MPIPLPNLDDRTYADLVAEAQALIPHLYPAWTDHNPTDPGIALTELLAWLTEMVLYRLDQVPEANYWAFLELLNDKDTQERLPSDDLQAAIRQTVLDLRDRYRAVTSDDFEYLALIKWPATDEAKGLGPAGRIRRVHCIPRCNLEASDPTASAPGHVSLVVVPDAPPGDQQPRPTQALRMALWRFLDERRLLTTRHHIVGPDYVRVRVTATLYLEEDASPADVRKDAVDQLRAFFDPLTGGPEGRGWPFGRDVHVSEGYELLDQVPGVDYVRAVRLEAPDDAGRERNARGEDGPISITLDDHELVAVEVEPDNFSTM
jgi:hypothetical protein